MRRPKVLAFLAALVVVAGAARATRAATDDVGIQDFNDRPTTLTVDVGGAVLYNAAPGAAATSAAATGGGDASGGVAQIAVLGASVPLAPMLAIAALTARSGRRGR